MRLKTRFLLLLFVVICNARKAIIINNAGQCGRGQNDPIVGNATINYFPQLGYIVEVEGTLKEDLFSNKLWGTIRLERCASKENLDSCEYFASLKQPYLCSFISSTASFVSQFVDQFTPPLRCPFKKGFYYGHNVTLNVNIFNLFPIDGYYWKGNGSLYQGERYMGSACYEGSVMNLRE